MNGTEATGELWVHAPTGRVYRVPEAAWPLLRGRELRLSALDGRERQARRGRLGRFVLSQADGARALLTEGSVRAALLSRVEGGTPTPDRWLLTAAQAGTPEALVGALQAAGTDPGQLLTSLGQLLTPLDEQGGVARLGEVAGEAARTASSQLRNGTGEGAAAPVPLALLGNVLGRLAREDPAGLQGALQQSEGPPEDVYARTRAELETQLQFSVPSFSYADLLGREPDQMPKAESDE